MAVIRRYTRTAIALHWVIAVLMIVNVALIWSVELVPEGAVRPVIDTHKSIGITVLGLAILRILWRATHPPPPLPDDYPAWERWGAHVAHGVLYLVIFLLPLSGWAHDSAWSRAAQNPMSLFGLVPWPRIGWIMSIEPGRKEHLHDLLGAVHTSCAYVLYAMLAMHIAGALKHQWWDKQPELQRMLP